MAATDIQPTPEIAPSSEPIAVTSAHRWIGLRLGPGGCLWHLHFGQHLSGVSSGRSQIFKPTLVWRGPCGNHSPVVVSGPFQTPGTQPQRYWVWLSLDGLTQSVRACHGSFFAHVGHRRRDQRYLVRDESRKRVTSRDARHVLRHVGVAPSALFASEP